MEEWTGVRPGGVPVVVRGGGERARSVRGRLNGRILVASGAGDFSGPRIQVPAGDPHERLLTVFLNWSQFFLGSTPAQKGASSFNPRLGRAPKRAHRRANEVHK